MAEKDVPDIRENLDLMGPMALQASPENPGRSEAVVLTAIEEREVLLASLAKLDLWDHAGFQAKTVCQVRLENPVHRASQEKLASVVTVEGVVREEISVVPVSQVLVGLSVSRELRAPLESLETADLAEVPDGLEYRVRTEHLACQDLPASLEDRVNLANRAYKALKVSLGRKAPKENVVDLECQAPVATPVHTVLPALQGSPGPRISMAVTVVLARSHNRSIRLSRWSILTSRRMTISSMTITCARTRAA